MRVKSRERMLFPVLGNLIRGKLLILEKLLDIFLYFVKDLYLLKCFKSQRLFVFISWNLLLA